MMNCPSCKGTNYQDVESCFYCGLKFEAQHEPDSTPSPVSSRANILGSSQAKVSSAQKRIDKAFGRGFLKGLTPAATLDMEIGGSSFLPGDTIPVKMLLAPREKFHIRGGYLQLVCLNDIYARRREHHGLLGPPQLETERLGYASEAFLSATEVWTDMSYRHETTLQIPDIAPPSVQGVLSRTTWHCVATVDVVSASDLFAHREFTVLAPPPKRVPDSRVDVRYTHCDASMSLSATAVKLGETFGGTLEVRVARKIRPKEVKVIFERSESPGEKGETYTVGEVVLHKGDSLVPDLLYEWPFEFQVPNELMPSGGGLSWRVKSVVARRGALAFMLRGNYAETDQRIVVYNG